MTVIESNFSNFIVELESKGLRRDLVSIKRTNVRDIVVDNEVLINMSGNDYLGLTYHPEVMKRAQLWMESYGAGCGASRLVTGNLDLFHRIENKLAELKSKPAGLILASGFQANATVLEALFDKKAHNGHEALVFADILNHASMHFACRAANIRQIRYRHLDLDHLQSLLAGYTNNSDQPKFIITESVFSMDGDVAPIGEIAVLAKEYGCFLICDDAHATGILGDEGKGLSSGADCIIGTFSKALGSFGAFVACSKTVRSYLVNRCSGLIYSTALPPAVLGSIDAAIDLLPGLDERRNHVQHISQRFHDGIKKLGFDTHHSQTQIVPLITGTSERALNLSRHLRRNGFWVTAIRPPTVANGKSRLRFAFNFSLQAEDIDRCLNGIEDWSHKYGTGS